MMATEMSTQTRMTVSNPDWDLWTNGEYHILTCDGVQAPVDVDCYRIARQRGLKVRTITLDHSRLGVQYFKSAEDRKAAHNGPGTYHPWCGWITDEELGKRS